MPDVGRCELIAGEIIHLASASWRHGILTGRIGWKITAFVESHDLGEIAAAKTGFIIARNPDTVRAPNVAFVRKARSESAPERGFFDGPPDLAVEVISPDDTWSQVVAKAKQWLAAGAVSVWLADPQTKTIHVYRTAAPVMIYQCGDTLINEPTLPGFTLKLANIFKT